MAVASATAARAVFLEGDRVVADRVVDVELDHAGILADRRGLFGGDANVAIDGVERKQGATASRFLVTPALKSDTNIGGQVRRRAADKVEQRCLQQRGRRIFVHDRT